MDIDDANGQERIVTTASCVLELVYFPVTAPELVDLKADAAFRDYVEPSTIYIIAQRKQLRFEDIRLDGTPYREINPELENPVSAISFNVCAGSDCLLGVTVDLRELPVEDSVAVDVHARLIKFQGPDTAAEPEYWFTPDRLLFDYWRGNLPGAFRGLEEFRKFTRYEVHYVGKATEQTTLSRLANHERYQDVLAKSLPMERNGHLPDEIVVMLFRVIEGGTRSIPFHLANQENLIYSPPSIERYVNEAEKAVINVLLPPENRQTYRSFPRSTDGLDGLGFASRIITLGDCITLYTRTATFNGNRNVATGTLANGDAILIEGNAVELKTWYEQAGRQSPFVDLINDNEDGVSG